MKTPQCAICIQTANNSIGKKISTGDIYIFPTMLLQKELLKLIAQRS